MEESPSIYISLKIGLTFGFVEPVTQKNNISRIFHPHRIFLKTTTSLDGSYESDIYTTFVNEVVISYQMLEF